MGLRWKTFSAFLLNPLYEGPVEVYANKYIVLGFDTTGNLLEIMYNEMEDGGLNVFHAMPCRSIFESLLPDRY
jgi:hypothetical protein